MVEFEEGTRVAVSVDGERRTGVVVDWEYTVKYGQPLFAVALDEPLPDGRDRHLAHAESIERSS
jgi:hypothetical protein